MTPCSPEQRVLSIQAATARSQGQRSSSVSAMPLCILSTLETGWNQSASANSHRRLEARSAPTVDFPHPETPMTITTAGAGGEAPFNGRTSLDIISRLLVSRRDRQDSRRAGIGPCGIGGSLAQSRAPGKVPEYLDDSLGVELSHGGASDRV